MFKNIFKHKLVKDIKDKSIFSRNSDHGNHPMSPNTPEESHHNEKPFEIDLDNLTSYDQKELQAFIKKYEQYTHSLRGQFNDLMNECLLAREKLTLLDEERKRLMVENDQYKNQIGVFRKLVDEKALQAGVGPDFDKEALKQLENSGLEFEKEELNVSKQLKENAEKLIEELKRIILMNNGEEMNKAAVVVKKETIKEIDRQGQEESPREEVRTTSESDSSDCKPEGAAEAEAEAETEENVQQEEKEVVENPEEMKNNEVPQSQSPTLEVEGKMNVMLGQVETELRKVFEEHWNAIDQMLKKEKEMSLRLNMEILKSGKIEEYEKEIKELKGTAQDAEKLLQDTIVELENKVKEVEKNEKMVQETEAKLEQEKAHHVEEMMLQKKIAEDIQLALDKMKGEDEETKKIIEGVKKENNMLQQQLNEVKDRLEEYSEKVKQIENIQQEFYKIEQRNKELETEKEEFDDKYNRLETKRNDTENSLIQEKLKHHQTSGDLIRANEKLAEMEKNLNEEIEARKADVWKNEDLKKHIIELERKLKEYIKMIKKLSNKIAELENKEKNESNSSNRTNSDPDIQDIGSTNDTPNKQQECGNKGYYETRLEDAMSQINELKEANQKLVEEKEVLKGQAKILQDKRETGLQEIKRLSILLEQAKSSKGQNFIIPNIKTEEIAKPIKVGSMNTIKVSKKSKAQEDLNNLRRIKKGLDEVYKSIIMTITAESLREENAGNDRKATGKLGELVKGPLPSESFMTIEKKMNDTIVLFQEYMENFE